MAVSFEKLNRKSHYDHLLSSKIFHPGVPQLFVNPEEQFSRETAPPYGLRRDFEEWQKIKMNLVLAPQKFILVSMNKTAPKPLPIDCAAQVKMHHIESKWAVEPI